jgi:hypothetical protein
VTAVIPTKAQIQDLITKKYVWLVLVNHQ